MNDSSDKADFRLLGRDGFTILEVLVSTGIGVLLLGIVLTIVQVGGEGYARTSRKIDTNVEARSALRTLVDDLSTTQFDEFFGTKGSALSRWPSNELWFMALKSEDAQDASKATGDLCFIYYYTAVTRPLEGESGAFSRKLYRRLISSADVMSMLKGEEGTEMERKYDFKLPFSPPDPDPVELEDEPVAFNVVQFLAEPLTINGAGQRVPWVEGAREELAGGEGSEEPELLAPDLIRMTLQVTDEETAAILTEMEDWEPGSDLATRLLSDENGGGRLRTFQMTISFKK